MTTAIEELSTAARTISQLIGSAVVTIGRDGRGTGLVIAEGKVLTNAHNLRDRTTLVTFADGRAEQGVVAGADEDGDLVVIDVDTASITPVVWSDEPTRAGDVVLAVSRGGHRQRVSFGMVSSVDVAFSGPRGRTVRGGVEHTAPLARGASGGAIVDVAGRVLALNTHRTGRGFYVARPVDHALRSTIDQLVAGNSIARPRLGVALAPPDVAAAMRASVGLPARDGLLVRAVEPDGAAARADIAAGDLLAAVGDIALTSVETLYDALATAGQTLSLIVVRGTDERVAVVSFAPVADNGDASA
ncbi:MAG: serine protease [Ilumatobacteraceae bacterium]|nr:serine protease [Ilumatobacteraceae bacterium]